ncbi:MAG: response regulator [Pseudomonadota bacterium]
MEHGNKIKKILVVADELDILIFLSNLLRAEGFEVVEADNGEQGLAKARKNLPALIILDVMMPEESGIQTYQALKYDKRLQRIPVIMLSAINKETFSHYQKFESIKARQGIPEPEAFLEKPPEAEELINAVLKLMPTDRYHE